MKSRNILLSVLALVVLGVTIRIFLPSILLHYINQGLSEKLGVYSGHVEDLDLSLYRGAYQLKNFRIQKKNSRLPPLLTVSEIDLSLSWRTLLKGELAADIVIRKMIVQLTDSKREEQKQTGVEENKKSWQEVLRFLIPIYIESLKLRSSSLYFTNRDLKENLPVSLEKIDFDANNLRSRGENIESPFYFKAVLQNHAALWIKGRWNVLASPMRMDADFTLAEFQISKLNKVLLAYLPLDITAGTLEIYGEVALNHGRAKGYLNVFFKDGDIIATKQAILSAKHFIIEIASGFGNWLLKNNETKKVAVKIPFEYDGEKLNLDKSDIFWSSFKNVQDQIKPGHNHSISLQSVSR